MSEVLSSGVFPRIEEAVQHAVAGGPLYARVAKALAHIAPILGFTYEQQAESLFSELRKIIEDPGVFHTEEGPNFSGLSPVKLKRWLRVLLKLYGLASYELASERDMKFFFDLP